MELDKLKRHLKDTPLSELREEWKAVEHFSNGSPLATDLIKKWSEVYDDPFNPKVKWKIKESHQNKILKNSELIGVFF